MPSGCPRTNGSSSSTPSPASYLAGTAATEEGAEACGRPARGAAERPVCALRGPTLETPNMSMSAHLSFEGKDGRHGVGDAAKFEKKRSLRVGTRPTDSGQSLFYSLMVNRPLMFLP